MSTSLKTENSWLVKILSGFFTIGLMISSFFLNSAWDSIKSIQKDISNIQIEEATHSTKAEAMQHEKNDAQQKSTIDRQVTILESNMASIKESLNEIKLSNIRLERKIDYRLSKDTTTGKLSYETPTPVQ